MPRRSRLVVVNITLQSGEWDFDEVVTFAGRKFRTTDVKQAEMLRRLGAASVSLTLAEVPQAVVTAG